VPNPVRKRLKILLVEDNEADVWLFCEAFETLQIQHDIQVVRDGEAALNLLTGPNRTDAPPEIILLDINMPKIDGFAVLTTVRANPELRAIPIIILTSSRDQQDIRRAHELGANSYMYKSISDFSDLVGDFDRYWLRRAEIPLPPEP
jgi:CheY-like chemotaxis protein